MTVSVQIDNFRKFLGFLGPRASRLLALGVLVGIGLFGAELSFAYGLQAFLKVLGATNLGNKPLPTWIPQKTFGGVLAFILFLGILRGLLQWAQVYMQFAANEIAKFQQRTRLLKWAYNSESVSTTRVTTLFNERTTAGGICLLSLQSLTIQATSAVLLGFSLLILAPSVTIVTAILLGVLALPMRMLNKRIEAAGIGIANEWEKTNSRLLMSIKNLLLMQIYGTQEKEETEAQAHLGHYLNHNLSFAAAAGFKFALPQIIGVFMICVISYYSMTRNVLSTGVLISYFYLFVRFMQNFSEVLRTGANVNVYRNQLKELAVWYEDHLNALKLVPKLSPKPADLNLSQAIGWRLENISFSYPDASHFLFEGLSLEVPAGSFTVILGPSGVGKSTLLNILLGNSTVSSGKVKVALEANRTEELQYVRLGLLKDIGYVGAESFLLEGTIRENIVYGLDHSVTDDEIKGSLMKAECKFIHDLPQGLQHRLTEQGQGLSAGQKQRLSLARALLRNPKALILDEATANLDHETEVRLVETLAKFKGQMTIIAVTHRQVMLEVADQEISLK